MAELPLPVPPRPRIVSVNPGTLFGAGGAGVQTLVLDVDGSLDGATAALDGAALASEASPMPFGRGWIKATVPMAGIVKGIHRVTVTDGNGESFGGVQVLAV